jgi:hypothetical protein
LPRSRLTLEKEKEILGMLTANELVTALRSLSTEVRDRVLSKATMALALEVARMQQEADYLSEVRNEAKRLARLQGRTERLTERLEQKGVVLPTLNNEATRLEERIYMVLTKPMGKKELMVSLPGLTWPQISLAIKKSKRISMDGDRRVAVYCRKEEAEITIPGNGVFEGITFHGDSEDVPRDTVVVVE